MPYTIIPAQPGWKCLFGDLSGASCEVWLVDIAAWKADEDGCMWPIIKDDCMMIPTDLESTDQGLITIFEPSEPIPSDEQMIAMAKPVLTRRAALRARASRKT